MTEADIRWYAYKYARVTNALLKYFDTLDVEVFWPMYKVKVVSTKGVGREESRPKIPCYIFIHSSLAKAIEVGQKVGLAPLRKRVDRYADASPETAAETDNSVKETRRPVEEEVRYVTIPDNEMRVFMEFVNNHEHELKMYSAAHIDLDKDDKVRIIGGDYEGCEGYLKTEARRDGGKVIVAVGEMNIEVEADPEHIAVIEFGRQNDHFTKKMQRIEKHVDDAMELYRAGQPVAQHKRRQLVSYYRRFGETIVPSDMQRFRHMLILYRIYTVLEMPEEREAMYQTIMENVLPLYEKKCKNAIRHNIKSFLRRHREYVRMVKETRAIV